MKKAVLTAAIFLSAVIGVTVQKNTLPVYGNLELHSSKNAADVKTSTFSLSPEVGYQFTDNWTAGVNVATSTMKYGGHK